MTVQLADIRTIPLFRDIPDARLTDLIRVFETMTFPEGQVLFRTGEIPTKFLILTRGEVTLEEADRAKFRVRPFAPIGELGSLTGLPRNTTATAATEVEVMGVGVNQLLGFFEKHADIAFPFYKNLLGLVSSKIRRDDRRMDEMRANLIRTQKTMKNLREVVLSSDETVISKPVFEALDDLIERNRRSHYRVTPVESLPASIRLDDGATLRVIDLSDGYLKLDTTVDRLTKDRSHWAGVLAMGGPEVREILVSGSIERDGPDGVVVKLDGLIDTYKHNLEDYVTRLQLLDYVV